MLEPKEAFTALNTPEVIEERNKRIAARIGKELEYGAGKMQELYTKISGFSADPNSRRMIEFLYKEIWTKKPKFTRDHIQQVISKCHGEAFDWFQQNYMYMDARVADAN